MALAGCLPHAPSAHPLLPPPSAPPLPLQAAPDRSDHDILRDSFRFIRSEGEDAEAEAAGGSSWEVRLARRYYR